MEESPRKDRRRPNGFIRFFRRRDPAGFFIAAMAVSAALFFGICLFLGAEQFTSIFFRGGEDLFMDYFNSLRDSTQLSGAYTERHVIYPPMANLIFLICSRFVPEEYASLTFENRQTWTQYPAAALSCILWLLVLLSLLALVSARFLPFGGKKRAAVLFFALMNAPVLFLAERANILLLSVVSLAVYALTYRSESRLSRELGLLALAFSFSVKLYPAVFGWFLIADKRYKDAIRCAVYGAFMLLLPSFFFGGPQSILWTLQNIAEYPTGPNGWERFAEFFGLTERVFRIIYYPVLLLLAALFALSAFLINDRRKTWALGCAILSVVPSLHALYIWVFALIPLLMTLASGKLRGTDWLYFIGLLIPFLFLPQFSDSIDRNYTTVNTLAMVPAALLLIAASAADLFFAFRERKKPKALPSALS